MTAITTAATDMFPLEENLEGEELETAVNEQKKSCEYVHNLMLPAIKAVLIPKQEEYVRNLRSRTMDKINAMVSDETSKIINAHRPSLTHNKEQGQ